MNCCEIYAIWDSKNTRGHARTFCVNVNFQQTRKQQKRYRFEHQIKGGELTVLAVLPAGSGSMRGVAVNASAACWETDHMRAELCTAALMTAKRRYGLTKDCIVHSDRGSQFTSYLYREILVGHGLRQSMGRTGSCYDNARAESFFATLKKDLIYRLHLSLMTKKEVRAKTLAWIEVITTKNAGIPQMMAICRRLKKREAYNRQLSAA